MRLRAIIESIQDQAHALCHLADAIAKGEASLQIPDEDTTVSEAYSRLGAVLEGFTIEMRIGKSRHTDKASIEWCIWDGADHHTGGTLGNVVAAVIAKARCEIRAEDAVVSADKATASPLPY